MGLCPKLEPSYASIEAFLAWVVEEHLTGRMDRMEAKEFREHANAMLKIMKAKHSETELDEARALVARAEKAVRQGDGKATQERYGGGKAA